MRNRVSPLGDIIATELRGAWLGNRGILHRGTEIVQFHASDLWIYCVLSYKGWRLPQWADGHCTILFFHDEAVALAAGHRPCALCQRPRYNEYRDAWAAGTGGDRPSAKEIDRRLHGERIVRGTHRRRLHRTRWADLPTGVFVLVDDGPVLVVDDRLVPWPPAGYGPPRPRPSMGTVDLITPPASLAAVRAGFHPQLAPEAVASGPNSTHSAALRAAECVENGVEAIATGFGVSHPPGG
jgi:hypothetical protein